MPAIHFPDGFVVRFDGVPGEIDRSRADLVTVRALASGPAWLTIEPPSRG